MTLVQLSGWNSQDLTLKGRTAGSSTGPFPFSAPSSPLSPFCLVWYRLSCFHSLRVGTDSIGNQWHERPRPRNEGSRLEIETWRKYLETHSSTTCMCRCISARSAFRNLGKWLQTRQKRKKIQKLRFPFRLFNIRYAQLSSFDFIYTSVDLEIRFVARHKEHVWSSL